MSKTNSEIENAGAEAPVKKPAVTGTVTEFFDGQADSVEFPSTKHPGTFYTKYVITTRSGKSIWLRTQPLEKHNTVTYLPVDDVDKETGEPVIYYNNATTSYRLDSGRLADLNQAIRSAKASNFDANKDRIEQSSRPDIAAQMLDFDATKLLDYL